MTYQQAKQKLTEAGYQGEPTPEALKAAGWDVPDYTAGVQLATPAVTVEDLKLHTAAAIEEASAGGAGASVVNLIARLGAMALSAALA